ncbi:hypothetical protein NQZ68_016653 [Dissostichus eleginoides]|nr:hypothetical protein NQZ68_016653 [Dissostichus eleginoides]
MVTIIVSKTAERCEKEKEGSSTPSPEKPKSCEGSHVAAGDEKAQVPEQGGRRETHNFALLAYVVEMKELVRQKQSGKLARRNTIDQQMQMSEKQQNLKDQILSTK